MTNTRFSPISKPRCRHYFFHGNNLCVSQSPVPEVARACIAVLSRAELAPRRGYIYTFVTTDGTSRRKIHALPDSSSHSGRDYRGAFFPVRCHAVLHFSAPALVLCRSGESYWSMHAQGSESCNVCFLPIFSTSPSFCRWKV